MNNLLASDVDLDISRKKDNKRIAAINMRCGIMAVDIKSHLEIGAKLEWVLEILAFCEEKKLTPQFKFTYPDSDKNENYFESFFEIKNKCYQNDSVEFITIHSIGELELEKNYDQILNIKLASSLINKYLVIKNDVLQEVDEFCLGHFANRKVLGVHYRGTDKSQEAPRVTFHNVQRNINYYLERFPETGGVFLSSDDENFNRFAENCSFVCPVFFRKDTFRSRGKVAIHHSV